MKNMKKIWAVLLALTLALSLAACGGKSETPAAEAEKPAEAPAQEESIIYAVEAGSAGEDAVIELGNDYNAVLTQADALMEVAAGTSDACIIDLLMAGAMIGEGTSYPELTYTVKLTTEEYGVGFKIGSGLAEKFNDFYAKAYADGTVMEIAEKYGVQESIIAK